MSIQDTLQRKANKWMRLGRLYIPKNGKAVNVTKTLREPKNILLIPFNRLGTILLATQVFKSIREHYTDARITVAVNHAWSVLIQNDPTIDELITFGDEIEDPYSATFRETGEKLARHKFDLAFFLSYQFDPNMAYLTRLSNAAVRASCKSGQKIQYFNVEVVPEPGLKNEVSRYLEMLDILGIPGKIRDFTMTISDNIRQKAATRYLGGVNTKRLYGFDLTREIVGDKISYGEAKSIIGAMISDLNATVIVFYDPRKYKLAEKLLKHFEKQAGANRVVLVEDRPVSMIAGLMSFCRCLVTRNTDLFQLAVALRIPTVALLKDHEIIQWSPEPNDWLSHVKRPDESWPTPRSITKTARELVSS